MCNPPCPGGYQCDQRGECIEPVQTTVAAEHGIDITCNKPETKIYVNGELTTTYQKPLHLSVKSNETYELKFIRKGDFPVYRKLSVAEGETVPLDITMKPVRFRVTLNGGVAVGFFSSEADAPIMHLQTDFGIEFFKNYIGFAAAASFEPNDDSVKSGGKDLPLPIGAGIIYRFTGLRRESFAVEPGFKLGLFPYEHTFTTSTSILTGSRLTTTYLLIREQNSTIFEPLIRLVWGGKRRAQGYYEFSAGFGPDFVAINPIAGGVELLF
jgi:hypothetical protein